MLLTTPQNEFALELQRQERGAQLHLDPGYQEAYAAWTEENQAILYKLSPEEKTQSFSDALQKSVQKRQEAIIEATEKDPSKKKALLARARRGELLLVSEDSQHFDQVLTLKQVQERTKTLGQKPLVVLSPTLRSSTNDWKELVEEQMLLHVAAKLREQRFLVEAGQVKDGLVQLKVTHPRRGNYQVTVPVNPLAVSTQPLEYTFVNAAGTTHVLEVQLPEAYGEATALSSDFSPPSTPDRHRVQEVTRAATLAYIANQNLRDWKQQKDLEQAALVLSEQNTQQSLANAAAIPMAKLMLANVMAAKAAMQAKLDESLATEAAQEQEKQSALAMQLAARKKMQEEAQKRAAQQKNSPLSFGQKAVWVGGAAAGLATGGGGLAFFIIHAGTLS